MCPVFFFQYSYTVCEDKQKAGISHMGNAAIPSPKSNKTVDKATKRTTSETEK